MKIHLRDIRLRNNAGMDFPHCQANARLLDTDKGRWKIAGYAQEVTCKHCINKLYKEVRP